MASPTPGPGDHEAEIALWREGGALRWRRRGEPSEVLVENLAVLPLKGPHNALNMMCAAGAALAFGLEPEPLRRALQRFEPLPHRVELVGQVGAVRFVDDSKATNVHAALAGLRSVTDGGERPLVVVAGGVDKGLELEELSRYLAEHATAVVLIGEIAARLEAALREAGMSARGLRREASMEDAVRRAYELARPDGLVILSPACSSFDMFESYAHRGRMFQQAVRGL